MDNHPIPQDVTNFEFRLIGDMTLKQFGYIVGGVVFAWLMLASPLFFPLKLLLAGGCVMVGVVLAFVPIEGRSADVMVLHFIKALFSPTQFIYQKLPQAQPIQKPIKTVTSQPPKEGEKKEEKKEEKVEVETFAPIATAAVKEHLVEERPQPVAAPMLPPQQDQKQQISQQPSPAANESAVQEEVQHLAEDLAQAKKIEELAGQGTIASTQAHEKVTELEEQLQQMMQQKQELERQLVALQKGLTQKKEQIFAPTTAEVPQETQHVKKIPKQMSADIGAPLVPDVPNLVTGVIKDPRGNVLANILIEVKDKDANPVRAFKTNQLGQFAAATPLTNGVYTMSFEDPAGKQSFDSVEISANGEIMLPLEITSVDAREKLRQELFGSKNSLSEAS